MCCRKGRDTAMPTLFQDFLRTAVVPEPLLMSHVTMEIAPHSIACSSLMQLERRYYKVHCGTSFNDSVIYLSPIGPNSRPLPQRGHIQASEMALWIKTTALQHHVIERNNSSLKGIGDIVYSTGNTMCGHPGTI